MANQVLGKDVVTQILIDGIWYRIFCGKTAELALDQDEIEVTHVNSGSSREYVPGMSNSMLNLTGVTIIDNTEGRVSITYLNQLAVRRGIGTYRVVLTAVNGTSSSITFNAFVRNTNLSGDVTQWSQSTASFRITGDWTFSSVVPPPTPPSCEIEDTLYKTLAEGGTSVQDNALIPGVGETITILSVSRSGSVHYFTTGTPGSLEFAYDDATGTISFDPANPGNPASPDLEPISIMYKIEV